MSTFLIYAPLERRHSQLSFDTLIVKIGSQAEELHGFQLLHAFDENLHVFGHVHIEVFLVSLITYICTLYACACVISETKSTSMCTCPNTCIFSSKTYNN